MGNVLFENWKYSQVEFVRVYAITIVFGNVAFVSFYIRLISG